MLAVLEAVEQRSQLEILRDLLGDETSFENVPLETVQLIRVQYEDAGVLEPMRYDWDD